MTNRKPLDRWLPLLIVSCLCLTVSGVSSVSRLLAQDAAQVSPKVVKVKFENERVRVLETVSNPGDKELQHSHPANILYVIAGGKLRITTADGQSKDVEFKTGDTLWREAVTHSAENIGTTQLHAIIVELKKP